MNNALFFFLCSFLMLKVSAQEHNSFQGKVMGNGELLENVHINNISTKKYVVSGAEGSFRLKARAGDTLVFSHVGMLDLIKFVEQEELSGALV